MKWRTVSILLYLLVIASALYETYLKIHHTREFPIITTCLVLQLLFNAAVYFELRAREDIPVPTRMNWVVIVLLFPIIGGAIYFFMLYRKKYTQA